MAKTRFIKKNQLKEYSDRELNQLKINYCGFALRSYLKQPIVEHLLKESENPAPLPDTLRSCGGVIKYIFVKYDTNTAFNEPNLAFNFSTRKSNNVLFQQYLEKLAPLQFQTFTLDELNIEHKISFSPLSIAKKAFLILQLSVLWRTALPLNSKLKILKIACEGFCFYELIKTKNVLLGKKNILNFYDATGFSNIIATIANEQGVNTVTLQHGVPLLRKEGLDALPSIVYPNIESLNILAWGDYSRNALASLTGKPLDSIHLAGHPGHMGSVHAEKNEKAQLRKIEQLIVFPSQKRWRKSNLELVRISTEFSLKHSLLFFIKLHPSDNPDYYIQNLNISAKNFITEYDASIISKGTIATFYHTTMYYELMVQGALCFRYRDEGLTTFPGLDDFFWDFESLQRVYNQLKDSYIHNNYRREVEPFIRNVFGDNSNFNVNDVIRRVFVP